MKSATFEEVVSDQTSKYTKIPKEEYLPAGKYKIIDQGQQFIGGYTNRKDLINASNLPVIVFGDHTKIFKFIDFPFTIGADGTKVLSVKRELADTKYVYYFLKSLKLPVAGYSRHFKFLKGKRIPLPQINDQIHIANVLSRCEELMCKRKESLRLLDEFLKSTFLEMFGDPVRNERNLKQVRLDALGVWKSGGTPSRANSNYFHGNIPWITSGELNEMYISDSKEKITEEAIENSNADLIMPGSILLGMYDTAALKSSINTTIATCNQAIAYSKLNSDLCNTVFIYFNIQLGRDYFRRQQRGVRQKNMNLSMIKSIKVLLPGLDEQIKFARIVERTQIIKAECLASLQELKNLHASLSERAFRGRLTVIDKHLTNAAHQEGMYHRIGR